MHGRPSLDDALPAGSLAGPEQDWGSSAHPAGQKGVCGLRGCWPGLSATHIRFASLPTRDRLFLLLQTLPVPLPPFPGVTQLPVSVFYFQSKAGPPGLASSATSLSRPFPSIPPCTGWEPRAGSQVRVTPAGSEEGLTPLSSTSSLSCFLLDHSHQHVNTSNSHLKKKNALLETQAPPQPGPSTLLLP